MTFFKTFTNQKGFSTRNVPILLPKFSDDPFLVIYCKGLLSIQAILKRNFHPKFADALS